MLEQNIIYYLVLISANDPFYCSIKDNKYKDAINNLFNLYLNSDDKLSKHKFTSFSFGLQK